MWNYNLKDIWPKCNKRDLCIWRAGRSGLGGWEMGCDELWPKLFRFSALWPVIEFVPFRFVGCYLYIMWMWWLRLAPLCAQTVLFSNISNCEFMNRCLHILCSYNLAMKFVIPGAIIITSFKIYCFCCWCCMLVAWVLLWTRYDTSIHINIYEWGGAYVLTFSHDAGPCDMNWML